MLSYFVPVALLARAYGGVLQGFLKFPVVKKSDFEDVINNIPASNINTENRALLHEIRGIRNGLLHNDEDLCTINDEYVVRFKFNQDLYAIYESKLQPYREKLESALNITKTL
jgi:hypothetical protein